MENPSTTQEGGVPVETWGVWSQRPGALDELCRALSHGSLLRQWARTRHFDFHDVANWLLDDPTRAAEYHRSQRNYALWLREDIIELSDDSSQDLITDENGKTVPNHAHFQRNRIQIAARRCALRELRAPSHPARDQKEKQEQNQSPKLPTDVRAEILKLGRNSKPSQPAYDPGPPPLSRPAPASQSAIATVPLLHNPNPTFTPNPPAASQSSVDGRITDVSAQPGSGSDTLGPVTHPASRTTSPEVPSRTTPDERPTTNNEQRATDQSAIRTPQSAIAAAPGPLTRLVSALASALSSLTPGGASNLSTPPAPDSPSTMDAQVTRVPAQADSSGVPPARVTHEAPRAVPPASKPQIHIPPAARNALLRALRGESQEPGAGHVVEMASTPSLRGRRSAAGSASPSAASISEKGKAKIETQEHTPPLPNPTPNLPPVSESAIRVDPCNPSLPPNPTFPSFKAYLRAIRESNWIEGQPLPFVYRPTPAAPPPEPRPDEGVGSVVGRDGEANVGLEPTLLAKPARAERASQEDSEFGEAVQKGESAPSQSAIATPPSNQTPTIKANGAPPRVDWHKLVGIRKVGMILVLFYLYLATVATNLHASIHSLAIPIKECGHGELSFPIREISEIRVCPPSWLTPLPTSGFRLPASSGLRNPSQTFRHSRDAPIRPPCDA